MKSRTQQPPIPAHSRLSPFRLALVVLPPLVGVLPAAETSAPPPNAPARIEWNAERGKLRLIYRDATILEAAVGVLGADEKVAPPAGLRLEPAETTGEKVEVAGAAETDTVRIVPTATRTVEWRIEFTGGAAGASSSAAPVDMQQRAQELKSLKWGMFVCWSLSTFSGKEWTPGVKDVDFFAAKGCDTDQWARTAKDAGMGYILFLTKHHDGFCLWDTKTTERKVTKSPLGIDVLAKLRKSCDAYGIKLALYFSEGDWTFPGSKDGQGGGSGPNPDVVKAQLEELCTQYGPIEFYWMDCAAGHAGLDHQEITAWVKRFQPGCFVGFNGGGGDLRAGEMGKPGKVPAPYLVGEFTYPILPDHDGGAMWFYSLPRHDGLCRKAEQLYRDYAGAVKHGNIFSLDVGPDYEGKLRKIDVETLRKVGEMIENPPPAPPPALSTGKPARASSVWPSPGYEADKALDDDDSSRWGAGADARSGWIEVDLGAPTSVGRAVIKELGYHRTQGFAIEYRDGETWKAAVAGTTLAGEKTFDFAPVTARFFRLNIVKANEVPTIEEFQLFAPVGK